MQIPIDLTNGALYKWTLELAASTFPGHVVVRGPNADQIDGWAEYKSGREYWYAAKEQSGTTDPAKLTMKLLHRQVPDDQNLIDAITTVRANETLMGNALMVPDWQSGAPLPSGNPVVLTLSGVANGVAGHDYSPLYSKVSVTIPIDGDVPLMPAWYTSISDLYGIFGGSQNDPKIVEGIVATFTQTKKSKPGWPDPDSWDWYGRDPS